jgi:PRTRC genetic system protein A
MNPPSNKLLTPILLKTEEDTPWPDDESVFYLLTANGLYLCRNHPFFTSSVPVSQWPQELAEHAPFLRLRYPRIPQRRFEQIVGFFAIIGESFGAEAAVLLAWDKVRRRFEIIVPPQRSRVSRGWGGQCYPLSVEYDMPPLPEDWIWLGDIHSHADEPAFASFTDEKDEQHRPGLHIVVGRILSEPPQFHIEAIVDGMRFRVKNTETVLEGYERRRVSEVPGEWIDQVEVRRWTNSLGYVRIHPGGDPVAQPTAGRREDEPEQAPRRPRD